MYSAHMYDCCVLGAWSTEKFEGSSPQSDGWQAMFWLPNRHESSKLYEIAPSGAARRNDGFDDVRCPQVSKLPACLRLMTEESR